MVAAYACDCFQICHCSLQTQPAATPQSLRSAQLTFKYKLAASDLTSVVDGDTFQVWAQVTNAAGAQQNATSAFTLKAMPAEAPPTIQIPPPKGAAVNSVVPFKIGSSISINADLIKDSKCSNAKVCANHAAQFACAQGLTNQPHACLLCCLETCLAHATHTLPITHPTRRLSCIAANV